MWQYHALAAFDLARERARDMELAAARHRLAREAADMRGHGEPPRPNRLRSIVARPVRAFSDATHAVSDAACNAATRIEGRMA